ncbi:MAG: rhodanese-like domain-containing protein [Myxococcota bacterium]
MKIWLAVVFCGVLAGGCAKEGESPPAPPASPSASAALKPLPDEDPALAQKLVEDGALLLDVRSPEEFAASHIKGANNVPIEDLAQDVSGVKKLASDPNRPIVVYCMSGGRAGRAKKVLTEAGYTQVTNLGGLSDWPDRADIEKPSEK